MIKIFSNISLDKDTEKGSSTFEPGEKEVFELSRQVQSQIDANNLQREAFKLEQKWKARYPRVAVTQADLNKLYEKLNNPQSPALELIPDFAKTSLSHQCYKNLIQIQENYQSAMYGFEIMDEVSKTENINIFKMWLQFFSIPRGLIRDLIKYPKNRRIFLDLILKACFVCLAYWAFYQFMTIVYEIVSPLLKRAFLALQNQLSMPIEKLKKQLNLNPKKEDQIEESREFWDNQLGSLSQVLKISRGGILVPIREANIYEFSPLDQEQAFLFVSPISAYIKFQRSKLELEKLIVEYQQIQTQPKGFRHTMEQSYLKVKELPSNLTNSWLSKKVIKKVILILILSAAIYCRMPRNRETMLLDTSQTLPNYERFVAPHPPVSSILPRVELSIKEENRNRDLSQVKMKDSLNTTSRLKSKYRVRKKAKVVRLADLPPLPDNNFESEIDSTPIPRRTPIKIRLD